MSDIKPLALQPGQYRDFVWDWLHTGPYPDEDPCHGAFRAQVLACLEALEAQVADLTRERDEARAALRALWDADSGTREAFIDEPDEALTGDAQLLRDAWRAIRKALGEGD